LEESWIGIKSNQEKLNMLLMKIQELSQSLIFSIISKNLILKQSLWAPHSETQDKLKSFVVVTD
jgi:hypothetical protein